MLFSNAIPSMSKPLLGPIASFNPFISPFWIPPYPILNQPSTIPTGENRQLIDQQKKLFRPWIDGHQSKPKKDTKKKTRKMMWTVNAHVECVQEEGIEERLKMEQMATNLGRSSNGHRCIYCDKLYSRKYGLRIHLRTHTGFKPLRCKICKRAFGDPSNLNKHTRLHVETSVTSFKCSLCEKMLVRKRDLDRHLVARHTPTAMLRYKQSLIVHARLNREKELKQRRMRIGIHKPVTRDGANFHTRFPMSKRKADRASGHSGITNGMFYLCILLVRHIIRKRVLRISEENTRCSAPLSETNDC